jgi:hypothetical protein
MASANASPLQVLADKQVENWTLIPPQLRYDPTIPGQPHVVTWGNGSVPGMIDTVLAYSLDYRTQDQGQIKNKPALRLLDSLRTVWLTFWPPTTRGTKPPPGGDALNSLSLRAGTLIVHWTLRAGVATAFVPLAKIIAHGMEARGMSPLLMFSPVRHDIDGKENGYGVNGSKRILRPTCRPESCRKDVEIAWRANLYLQY